MCRIKIIKFLSLLLLSTLCFSMLFSCSGIKFKVEFIVDGEVYKTVSTSDKSEIEIPKNPEKEGYEFVGWYLDEGKWDDPFTANSLSDTPISDDMVLKVYAKFNPVTEEDSGVKFKVEFIVDGEVYKTVSTSDESEIEIPKNPEKEGFEFDGWYLDEGKWDDPFTANSLLDTPISDDMVLKVYAKFIPVVEEFSDFLFKACDGGYEVIGYT